MARFDPEEGVPYGKCEICAEELADRAAVNAHLAASRTEGGSSHRVRLTNLTRPERITQHLEMEANDAIDEAITSFVDAAARLLDREGVTLGEINEAVKKVYADADWSDAWREYVDENDLDEADEPGEPRPAPEPHSTLEGLDV